MPAPFIERAAELFQPWAQLYGDSLVAQGTVGFLHLAGLLVAGGMALSADRMALRERTPLATERLRVLREVERAHRPVLAGLAVVIFTGLALLAADLETLLPSPVFWVKMALFGALLANGYLLRRSERKAVSAATRREKDAGWNSLRTGAAVSLALWGAVLLAGSLLTLAA